MVEWRNGSFVGTTTTTTQQRHRLRSLSPGISRKKVSGVDHHHSKFNVTSSTPSSPSSSSSSSLAPSSTNFDHSEGTHVWVQRNAMEAAKATASKVGKISRTTRSLSPHKRLSFGGGGATSPRVKQQQQRSTGAAVVTNGSDCESDMTSSTASSSTRSHYMNTSWNWVRAIMCGNNSKGIIIRLQSSSETITLPDTALKDGTVVLDNEYPVKEDGKVSCPSDLITLTHLHEPSVVFSLEQRYHEDIIYTATGPVLLALNPLKPLRQLYCEATMKIYWDRLNRKDDDLPPHVFKIADVAFRNMMRTLLDDDNPQNQAILVSGESGAGKTVTTKWVLKYLAALSQKAAQPTPKPKRAYLQVQEKKEQALQSDSAKKNKKEPSILTFGANSIESKVLQSNPILESFGNARTIRNDNSSRFGKFIEIQFTKSGTLVGATIQTYLLEKVRLIRQATGERNYHIFYEILTGMSKSTLRQYFLAPTAAPDDFCLLHHSGTHDRRDGVLDSSTYQSLVQAMNTMKFTPVQQKDIFSVAAALLHASNLELVDIGNDQSQLNPDNIHLSPCCQLLGVTPMDLNSALCTFSIQAGRGNFVRRTQSKTKAEKGLDALIKATYGALFDYLVMRINDTISCTSEDEPPVATIGVLDIFGFESFQTNSFEQLCINYCNEALQQQFNAFVLKNEQEEYEREGIEWSFIEFPENQDVLDLIDKRGQGILNILDDHCRAPGTTDRSFASDVYAKCQVQGRFKATHKQVAVLQFEINHYAGPVEYTAVGFVEKNKDELPKESAELLWNSSNPFVSCLSEILTGTVNDEELSNKPFQGGRADSSQARKKTVGGQFRGQLRDLRTKIDKTSPHYVRCLKPNDHLVPDHFDAVVVAEQLRCGGILEAVRVSRAGFPQHYAHEYFYKRYKCVSPSDLSSSDKKSSVFRASFSPVVQKRWEPPRHNAYRQSQSFPPANRGKKVQKQLNYKDLCRDLIRIIHRRIQQFEAEEKGGDAGGSPESPKKEQTQIAKSKNYSFKTPPPSWSRKPNNNQVTHPRSAPVKSRYSPWTQPSTPSSSEPPVARPPSRPNRNVGIQLGKTKVFLRHKSFEILERIRSRDLSKAATKLNSIFRMYLCRIAFLPVRDAYRTELHGLWVQTQQEEEEEEERTIATRSRWTPSASATKLLPMLESDVRASIHNPVPRHLWGKDAPSKFFKWVLVDGIWVKNSLFPSEEDEEEELQ